MKNKKKSPNNRSIKLLLLFALFVGTLQISYSQVQFEKEIKITDAGLYFDGNKVGGEAPNRDPMYDYRFGQQISAHGDCIKRYKDFVFMTWYKGGKDNRHMMLTRYNTRTETMATIEFPHTHTGLKNQWWIGDTHNTIAIGISPKDGTIHLLFDMHSYNNSGAFKDDYFRYSYSKKNGATVSDADFKLNIFIKDSENDYTHVSLNGTASPQQFEDLTYPKFFLNDGGDLFFSMRKGGNDNGAYVFTKYNSQTSKWASLTQFNRLNAKNHGQTHNWGLYGNMKYINGKLRVGFQRRLSNKNDKYQYQNGFYYAYSNDQSGKTEWKDHTGSGFSIPFADADRIKVYEPGNLVSATGKDEVHMVGGFDWTVTDNGDVHIIGKVTDKKNRVSKNVHTYKPAGNSNFTTTTDFAGGQQLYSYGNNIYIIDIKNGRPFIQKADGGKNNFSTIYQPTGGKAFRNGIPYIYEGKLYYFMMENKTGSKQPLYLHIIDLGLSNRNGPDGYTFAANEKSTVNVSGMQDIAYGANGVFKYKYNQIADVSCQNSAFGGDPIQGVAKKCYVRESDLSGEYRLKNVGVNKYLDSDGTALRVNTVSTGHDKLWHLVKINGEFYNIDCKAGGRGVVDSDPNGKIVNSPLESPQTASDKQWKAIPLGDNVFQFKNKATGRDYLAVKGSTNDTEWTSNTGNNSKWKLEYVRELRSATSTMELSESIMGDNEEGMKVYPNPTESAFTIALKDMGQTSISIYSIDGKAVYNVLTSSNKFSIDKSFNPGIYIIKATGSNNKIMTQKLMIK